jgi:hypothetical protein
MTGAPEVVSRIEGLGGYLALEGDRNIRYRLPNDNAESTALLQAVKAEKEAIVAYLRTRATIPTMPHGVSLIAWKLKEPPVAIETCAVVVDTVLFAKSTLEQLRIALTEPKRWVGWSVPQLIDRLAQVGVQVALEMTSKV